MDQIIALPDLAKYVGQEVGVSSWITLDQARIQEFAHCTGDHQWIHVDPERAKQGPFGGPIAHGYLTLSLAPVLFAQVLRVDGISMGVNYGLNKVRFPAPVAVGSKVRMGATLAGVEDIAGGAQLIVDMTFEVEGKDKPVCVAQAIYRNYV